MSNTNFSDAYKELNSGQLTNSPKTVLQAYLGAFEAKDALAIQQLIGDRALIEMPLLKPSRLFGASEIFTGHQNAFRTIEDADFTFPEPIAENDSAAIAIGVLTIKRKNGVQDNHEVGVVAEMRDLALHRISLYLNSRNIRRLSDETIV